MLLNNNLKSVTATVGGSRSSEKTGIAKFPNTATLCAKIGDETRSRLVRSRSEISINPLVLLKRAASIGRDGSPLETIATLEDDARETRLPEDSRPGFESMTA